GRLREPEVQPPPSILNPYEPGGFDEAMHPDGRPRTAHAVVLEALGGMGGTAQRARAIDAFLRDIYGEAAIVRDGVLPAWVASRSPGHRAAGTAPPKG